MKGHGFWLDNRLLDIIQQYYWVLNNKFSRIYNFPRYYAILHFNLGKCIKYRRNMKINRNKERAPWRLHLKGKQGSSCSWADHKLAKASFCSSASHQVQWISKQAKGRTWDLDIKKVKGQGKWLKSELENGIKCDKQKKRINKRTHMTSRRKKDFSFLIILASV